tara:strand:+ start:1701 stop:2390 length:690 start_codon:yes stop_codon:yes gene_type:complete
MVHILNSTGGSDKINLIRYENAPTDKHKKEMNEKTPLITIDWDSIVPEPPSNTSDVTKIDLEQVQRLTRNLSKDDYDLIMQVDDDPENLFRPYAKKMGLKYPQELIDKAIQHIDVIVLKLKYKFRRARPFQVAPHLGYVISVIETSTHQTPAYPSGHQSQGSMAAEVLSSLYPEHKAQWHEFAALTGKARVMQGVHYPSDNESSVVLVKTIWENMRGNLDDKWSDRIKG